MKRMKNEQHGFMHVYSDSEEKAARLIGWVEESEPYPSELNKEPEKITGTLHLKPKGKK